MFEPTVNNFLRSLFLVVIVMLFYHLPTVIYKAKLSLLGLTYLLLCNDKSWRKPEDPKTVFAQSSGPQKEKTVIFVRHGESTWNETFNKGSHRSLLVFILGYIPNLIKALMYEFYLLLTGQIDSWFYDSPLSHLGLDQVNELGKFLQKQPDSLKQEELIAILNGERNAPKSLLVSSNLRRALSTVAAGFAHRLKKNPEEKILILPCLQEISRNPDTLSITPPYSAVNASWIEKGLDKSEKSFQHIYSNQCDMGLHKGNKPLDTNGLKRMTEFCDFVFSSDGSKYDALICGGHSIWFRSFFRTFLPYGTQHAAKSRKIVNGGCVAFKLLKTDTQAGAKYMVDPNSIQVIYGGF